MPGRFCRCKNVVTAACAARWPTELHLAAALGICNPWLVGLQCAHTRLCVSYSRSQRQISNTSSASKDALLVGQASSSPSSAHRPALPVLRKSSSVPKAAFIGTESVLSVVAHHTRGNADKSTQGSAAYHTSSAWQGQALAANLEAGSATVNAAAAHVAAPSSTSKHEEKQDYRFGLAANVSELPGFSSASSTRYKQSVNGSDTGQQKRQPADNSSQRKSNSASSGISSTNATAFTGNNASTGIVSGSSAGISSGTCKPVGSADVAYQSYPLPSYHMNLEEQNSYDKAKAVIKMLSDKGFKALIVGGWVRDKYLGRRASDIDIATNAAPYELKSLFRYVVELPRSTVKLSHQGEVLEVTSFRGISRAASMFGVAMDAELRDFTINALYYDPSTNQVLDFVGGVPDAEAGVLRLTANSRARLAEDPLRALRCVRFAVVMGLKMMPETAQAVREAAHMCSVQQGMPPRRIWLELRKLHRAEAQQPGSWCRSLRLCYHLGLLQHLFPWLQDPVMPDAAKQAVLVAEKLQQTWNGRNQQQQKRDEVPLSLLVAAMLHPASANRRQAYSQLEQYFPNSLDLEPINTLRAAADLTHGSSSSRPSDDAWTAVYASDHAQLCLDILAAWMPEALASLFITTHQSRMKQLANSIAHQQQLKRLEHDREQQDSGMMLSPASLAAAFEAVPAAEEDDAVEPEVVQLRHQRQQEELNAAIQALVGVEVQHSQNDGELEPGEAVSHS